MEYLEPSAVTLDPWTIENGALTPTLKIKRRILNQKFEKEIESMYTDFGKIRTTNMTSSPQEEPITIVPDFLKETLKISPRVKLMENGISRLIHGDRSLGRNLPKNF